MRQDQSFQARVELLLFDKPVTRNGFGTGANFQSQNIPESFRGVLLCFPFCKRAKSGLKQIFSRGELEKLTVAGFLPFSEMLNS